MNSRDKQKLGQDAINALSRLYHHGKGKAYHEGIAKLDKDVPTWRKSIQNLPDKTREIMNMYFAWDCVIKVLVAAGIIKDL